MFRAIILAFVAGVVWLVPALASAQVT